MPAESAAIERNLAELHVVLALDQGGHASRACVVDECFGVVAEASVAVATSHGGSGEVEQDADELAASLEQAAQSAAHAAAEVARRQGMTLRITAAGLATQRSTLVCFDVHSGAPLSPAISWQDRRNADWLAGFEPQRERIRQITGLPLSAHYGVGKMRWCLEHLAAVRVAAQAGRLQIAPLSVFLAARLTRGCARVDPANASRTLLWDVSTRDWSLELLELFGIDRVLLPPCTRTRTLFGSIPAPYAGSDAVTLTAVTGDQSAIPFAFGIPDPQTVYINLGTGAFLQRPLASRPEHSAPLLASVLAADDNGVQYCLEGTVNGAASAIAAFARAERVSEQDLWATLLRLPEEATVPIYVNGIGGLGSPYWREQRSYFTAEASVPERFAAVLESIAFLLAINFDYMSRRVSTARRVIVTGGLSRSDWLCRRLAALLEVPVLRGVTEATAFGVAALAGPHRSAPASLLSATFEVDELPVRTLERLRARRAQFQRRLEAGVGAVEAISALGPR